MSRIKFFASLTLAIALLAAQAGAALAAPPRQDTTISGTVQSIVLETDSEGVTTVVVTLEDSTGGSTTVRLSVDTAVGLGLVTLDANGDPVVNDAAVGTTVEIDPATVIPDEETTEEQHPVAAALANFFSSLLGIDYDVIMATHEEGVGFGVIAQALWLTNKLGGDTELFTIIVDAKQSGDYSAITLPDGTSPKNWGQFRKALLDHKENLGQIMSGHASNGSDPTTTTASPASGSSNGQGNGQNNGQNNGNGNNGGGKDKNKDKGKGKNNKP